MESVSEVIEILGFKVTESIVISEDKTEKVHFNIRNQAGEIVSQDFYRCADAVKLLRYVDAVINGQ